MSRLEKWYIVVNLETGSTRKLQGNSFLRKDCPNFKVYELVSTDKTEIVLYSPTLIKYLQKLRNKYSKAVVITSGNREILFNESVNGYKDSEHLYGLAVDIKINGVGVDRLYNACIEIGGYFCNVGRYSTHIHFGIQGYHRRA